jgi:hypothetical protein
MRSRTPDPRAEDLRLLGLPPGATWARVESRYRRLALSQHPDVDPARAAVVRFARIAAAYQRLSALRGERPASADEDLRRLRSDPRIRGLPPQELAMRLRHSSSTRVRAAAASLLGKAQGKETRRALLAALRDPEAQVRSAALDALGRVGRPADLPVILAAAFTARGAAGGRCWRSAARILGRSLGAG